MMQVNDYVPVDIALFDKAREFMKYPATDTVRIDHKTDIELYQTLIDKNVNTIAQAPSDIFYADTVPLKDIEIEIDERDATFSCGKGMVNRYRVIILDDLHGIHEAEVADVGYLMVYIPNTKKIAFMVSLAVQKGNNHIFPASACAIANIPIMANTYMTTWYAIQIALLHPKIKLLFDRPMKVPIHGKSQGSSRQRKVKYVKVHNLRVDDIKNITHEPGTINRKCLAWYVIGHWRQYKTGKKVFIQGYWKGKLRDLKRNLDERERVIEPNDIAI